MKKVCTKCGIEKPEEAYGFATPTRRRAKCKECFALYNKAWVDDHPGYNKEWDAKNRDKCRAKVKRHYYKDHELTKERMRVWHRVNRGKVAAAQKSYHVKHKVHYRELHQRWREQNREKHRASARTYKAKKKVLIKTFGREASAKYILELLEKAKLYRLCPLCKTVPEKWHLEHATPLIRGGGHTEENLYYSCADCNLRKGRQTLEEFCGKSIKEIPYLN